MSKINVLIADGRKLLREGVSRLLNNFEFRVVGEAADIHAATKLIKPLDVRVILLITGPAHCATESILQVTDLHPEVRIIVLAWSISARGVREFVNAGAAGCLTKECTSQELTVAIRTVAAGRLYLSPQLTDVLIERYVKPDGRHSTPRPLAPRELEILRRIATGHSTKEIAYSLDVSSKTIETHRRRIMEKLNLHSIAQLTQYAVMEGLISLSIPV